jgi:Zn ribbon nucleic-acid-binding protein
MRVKDVSEMLAEHWVPKNIIVECEECGEVLYNADKDADGYQNKMDVSIDIYTAVLRHKSDEDHWSYDMTIEKKPAVKDKIDMTVTVSDSK